MADSHVFVIAFIFAYAVLFSTPVNGGLSSYGDYQPSFKLTIPPAYSTVSFIRKYHSIPVSYSGFTNHGRGYHDPGYAIEFRSEGLQQRPSHGYQHEHGYSYQHHY